MDFITENLPCGVVIYHMFDSPRNTPKDESRVSYMGHYKTDEERDAAMTRVSDVDIAYVREGRWNSGTAQKYKEETYYKEKWIKKIYENDWHYFLHLELLGSEV